MPATFCRKTGAATVNPAVNEGVCGTMPDINTETINNTMNTDHHTTESGTTHSQDTPAATVEISGASTAAENAHGTPEMHEPNAASTHEETGASAYITALQAELSEAQANAEDSEKRYVYLQAEFLNFKRRKEEQDKELQKFTNREIVLGLLPVIDNFERALQAAEQTKSYEGLIGGVNGTLKQFNAFLQKAGVTPIEAVGKEFDPNYHEAIGHTDSSGLPANTVAEEVQRGYIMHDRVLRPSLVKVSE